MVKINRDTLLNDLFAFSEEGNGLIIGKPGVGKSYTLKELKKQYLQKKRIAFLIRIDQLGNAEDKSIEEELNITTNWIDSFKKIKIVDNEKALLIFDAFDAARNEEFREGMLGQIKRAVKELSGKWNILVSVRTYDADKSQKLMRLFKSEEDIEDNIYTRRKLIPELTEQEVLQATATNPRLSEFYINAEGSLQTILKIPFFLNLSDQLLAKHPSTNVEELKHLKSETQLLQAYWERVISHAKNHLQKEIFLYNLTRFLIQKKRLNCAKTAFISSEGAINQASFDYLRSENIIEEGDPGNNRLSFSHNIFFDYAVSVLVIGVAFEDVLSFIQEDLSRPFFLRPSFIYFFSNLWYMQRIKFWEYYEKLSAQPEKNIQLFARLIVTGVAASEYETADEVTPIIAFDGSDVKAGQIRNFLQSLRFLHKFVRGRDIEVLQQLSTQFHPHFIWEYGFLLDRAINTAKLSEEKRSSCGVSARHFLQYILKYSAVDVKAQLNRLGAVRGVELVAKTYDTDVSASRALFDGLFSLLDQPDFEIHYFSNLAQYVEYILPEDPEFVGKIYRKIFGHAETTNQETTFGSGVIMNFRSNRKQDFEVCHYSLTKFFPSFIEASPKHAVAAGIDVVNEFVLQDRDPYLRDIPATEFTFKNLTCRFISDMSSIWSSNLAYYDPAFIANCVAEYFETLPKEKKMDELIPLLELYLRHSKVGFTWQVLIIFGAKAVKDMPDYFIDFCLEEIFLNNADTSYEIGKLIKAGSEVFSAEQISDIEQLMFTLAEKTGELKEYTLRKYLSSIPFERLTLEKSKRLLKESGMVENRPIYQSMSTVQTYTDEMRYKDYGINLEEPDNAAIYKITQELKTFNSTWRNGVPNVEQWKVPFAQGKAAFDQFRTIQGQLNEHIQFNLISEIANTFAVISRDVRNLSTSDFDILKEIIYLCFNYISADDDSSNDSTPTRGYSPTPRIIASEALSNIAEREPSQENIKLLLAAVNDRNTIVRYHAITDFSDLEPQIENLYWETIYKRLEEEPDAFVAAEVLRNVGFKVYDEAKANRVISICNSREVFFTYDNNFVETFALYLMWFVTHHRNSYADQVLRDAYDRPEFAGRVIFKAYQDFKIVKLKKSKNMDFFVDKVIEWTEQYLARIENDLQTFDASETENLKVKRAFNLLDSIVQRIFFVFQEKKIGNRPLIRLDEKQNRELYLKIEPILKRVIKISKGVAGGMIIAHTAHYLIETLSTVLRFNPKDILEMVTTVTSLSIKTGYTFDSLAIREVVNLTEMLLADHRILLLEKEPFNNLVDLLDIYINSGWVEALELLWKLDEIFK